MKIWLLSRARAHRRRLRQTRFVALTGSAGKTTAKEVLTGILSTLGPVTANPRSANQPRPLARNVLRTRDREHAFCVQELGAWGPGTLDELLWPLEPDVAVVTNVGWDHRSSFRTQEAIAEEKAKAVSAVPPSGLVVLNADDPRVREMARVARGRVVLYGQSEAAQVRAEQARSAWPDALSFTLVIDAARYPVQTQLHGMHWVGPILAALAAAIHLGVPPEQAVKAVGAIPPTPHRLSVASTSDGVDFLLDDVKGSAWTVEAALEVLGTARARRRVAVIGQLSDGSKPKRDYRDLARRAREHADLVVMVGQWGHYGLRARSDEHDDSIVAFEGIKGAAEFLRAELRAGDLALLKGARAHHLTRILLNRDRHVGCWLNSCPKPIYCEDCEQLGG